METTLAAPPLVPDKEQMVPATCRAARALLDLSQAELAELADVSELTVRNYEGERRKGFNINTWRALKIALERAGVGFIDETDDHGAGVMLKKPRRPK